MGKFFKSQDWGRTIFKHIDFPVYVTDEFSFYRCVEFREEFYGKTVSELFNGNLRTCCGRYSKLFPGQKISYWADSPYTSRAEIKKHGASKNVITFWAYDDDTSTFPCLGKDEPLIIIDGRKCGVQELIDKADNGEDLTDGEMILLKQILAQQPDCLVYDSHAKTGGENYIFFEKGFKKLALRQLRLYLGERRGKNRKTIVCADTSDYMPFPQNYGKYFKPLAKIGMNTEYLNSEEYREREQNLEISMQKLLAAYENDPANAK